jgi:hypothetical protein
LPDFGAPQYNSTEVGKVPTMLAMTVPEVVVRVMRV